VSAVEAYASSVTVEDLDRDPYPVYARLRAEAPVCLVPAVGLWFVTRWEDVESAATRPDLFCARVDPSPLERTMGGESILLLDGEPQKRLRAMLDPSLRPRVVEASTPDLIEPLAEELLDGLEGRGEAELMSEYFEPISVLGLGRMLGLGHLDGDTLRRWFHGLAEGAINFEDDPAKWKVADATAAEIDVELAPVFERLFADPDGSTIATMLHLADGTLEERVATILPTLKVILLGGMQEPGHAAGTTLVGLLESRQVGAVLDDLALVRDAVDHERLHPAQHDAELLVHVAVERHGRAGLELDEIEHRARAEQRASADAVRECERTYLVETDEYGLHRHDSTPPHGRHFRPQA